MREVNMDNVTYGYKQVNGKYEIDYEKWIDLSGLPRIKKGIDWGKSVGDIVNFKYNDVKGYVEIVKYNKKETMLTVKYNEKQIDIYIGNFTRVCLGNLLDKRTSNFKVSIGDKFKDDRRDISIKNREYRVDKDNSSRKYYNYICNKCGYVDGWIREANLIKGEGCACCSSTITVPNINSIVAKEETHWMIKYFQGGYNEAKMYTPNSGKKVYFRCPDCGEVKSRRKTISDLYRNKSIGCCCSDGFSYPEKFVYSMLKQLEVEFITEYSPKWIKPKRYDFYIQSKNMIIETHGEQHYIQSARGRGLQKEQENDKYKRELALKNGIEYYIELDCRESNIEWIKNGISNSDLNKSNNLSKVDWNKCEEFAMNNLAKEVCEYWDNKDEWETVGELSEKFKISVSSIRRYLKRGNCRYIPEEEMQKNFNRLRSNNIKMVEIFKNNISLGIFNGCVELEKQSEKLFNVKLSQNRISEVALGKRKHHKGFTFKYIEENQNIAN